MTVPMNQRLRLLSLELQFPSSCLFFFHYEFFKQKRCFCNIRCKRILDEIRIFVPESQDAARFAAHNHITVFDEIMKLPNVKVRIFARGFRETLRNHRPAATPTLLSDANFISRGFEKLRCSLPNIGIVVVNKSVVEKDDLACCESTRRFSRRAIPFGEP